MQIRQYQESAAHIRRKENGEVEAVQPMMEHLEQVSKLAGAFAHPFGGEGLAQFCGLLHDVGKYSDEFQKRIWEDGPRTDHSTAGAVEAVKRICGIDEFPEDGKGLLHVLYGMNITAAICAYCIAGHHVGLMSGGDKSCEYGTLTGRLVGWTRMVESQGADIVAELPAFPPLVTENQGQFTVAFLIRMVYSCLVDADFLDTECFMKSGDAGRRAPEDVSVLKKRLNSYLRKKKFLEGDEGINLVRSKILSGCIDKGTEKKPGLFTLTVPTGGGKTVASLAFALYHATEYRMRRIIYVLPYCSIIDQTVRVFETIFGKDHVLAHYAEADFEDEGEEGTAKRLASENWDVSVIVTTSVQFFESLFSNRPSKCRKIHNIADSVIIFDEAQTLPIKLLKASVYAIGELVLNYHCSCVLCTATQPSLDGMFQEYHSSLKAEELCCNLSGFENIFERVQYIRLGMLTDVMLSECLLKHQKVLCIVSTRKQARELYMRLRNAEGVFHLSTWMRPVERQECLERIRVRLKKGQLCRVIATSLIEAGVDLDFPVVYRAYAGLDSEIQAAGRCNREGEHPVGDSWVYLFEPEEKYRTPFAMSRQKETAKRVTEGVERIDNEQIIHNYFSQLYRYEGEDGLDASGVLKLIREHDLPMNFLFPEIAKRYRIIDNNTWTILIPMEEESSEIAMRLTCKGAKLDRKILRRMGYYCVNIYEHEFLVMRGALTVVGERIAILSDNSLYDRDSGLRVEVENHEEYSVKKD